MKFKISQLFLNSGLEVYRAVGRTFYCFNAKIENYQLKGKRKILTFEMRIFPSSCTTFSNSFSKSKTEDWDANFICKKALEYYENEMLK